MLGWILKKHTIHENIILKPDLQPTITAKCSLNRFTISQAWKESAHTQPHNRTANSSPCVNYVIQDKRLAWLLTAEAEWKSYKSHLWCFKWNLISAMCDPCRQRTNHKACSKSNTSKRQERNPTALCSLDCDLPLLEQITGDSGLKAEEKMWWDAGKRWMWKMHSSGWDTWLHFVAKISQKGSWTPKCDIITV